MDGFGEWVGVFVPDLSEEVFGAEGCGGGSHERFEDLVFVHGEFEACTGAGGDVVERVECDVRDLEESSVRGWFAACEAADAQDEFVEVEGFGEVVVGAEPESADPFAGERLRR